MNRYTTIFDTRGGLYNSAQRRVPRARQRERQLLMERMGLAQGLRVLDVPAGGGYLADGLLEADLSLEITCLEPSAPFAAALDPAHRRVQGGMERLPFASATFDRVGSLSGMHHLEDPTGFVRECGRVLRPGGIVALADVGAGTPTAAFLNGSVDRWTETGHDGRFFNPGDASTMLRAAGLVDVDEAQIDFTWNFPDLPTLVTFCRELFGMVRADAATVEAELCRHFALAVDDDGARLPWALVYASGRKP